MQLSFGSPFVRKLAAAGAVTVFALPIQGQGVGDTIFAQYHGAAPTVEKAGKEVEAHRFEEAKKLLDPVLKAIPDHVGAHFLLARMAYETRDFKAALSQIEISEQSLKDLGKRYAAVMARMKANDDADAIILSQSIRDIQDSGADSVNDVIVSRQQKLDQIEDRKRGLFQRDANFSIPSVYSLFHGNCLYRLGRLPEAAVQYQAAVKSDPSSQKAWNNLIAVYWSMKDVKQAKETLSKAEAAGAMVQPGLKRSVLEAK